MWACRPFLWHLLVAQDFISLEQVWVVSPPDESSVTGMKVPKSPEASTETSVEEGWKNLDSNRSIWSQPRTEKSHWLSSSDPEDQPSQQHNTNLSFVGDISVIGVSRKKLLKVSQTVGNQVLFLMELRWNFLLLDYQWWQGQHQWECFQ